MTIELLQRLSLIAFILAGVFLVISIILYFDFRIPNIIGSMTGSSRKAITQNQSQIEKQGTAIEDMNMRNKTDKFSVLQQIFNRAKAPANQTTIPDQEPQSDSTTTVTQPVSPAELDKTQSMGTTVLSPTAKIYAVQEEKSVEQATDDETFYDGFRVDYEIEFVESSEIIR